MPFASSANPADIRAARLAAGLSQGAAARLCLASRRAWIKWERGEHPMPASNWALYRLRSRLITLAQLEREAT